MACVMSRMVGVGLLLGLGVGMAGCQSTYFSAWEKLGYHKRDIMVSRVQKARDGQEQAKEQFKTTLERFKEVTKFNGGDLESKYKELQGEYDTCESRANAVTKQIESVEADRTGDFGGVF